MSIMDADLIMARIEIATPESPIAVFRCDVEGKLNAVFANTVLTRQWISNAEWPLVGIYHKGMNLQRIANFLKGIAGEAAA